MTTFEDQKGKRHILAENNGKRATAACGYRQPLWRTVFKVISNQLSVISSEGKGKMCGKCLKSIKN